LGGEPTVPGLDFFERHVRARLVLWQPGVSPVSIITRK